MLEPKNLVFNDAILQLYCKYTDVALYNYANSIFDEIEIFVSLDASFWAIHDDAIIIWIC